MAFLGAGDYLCEACQFFDTDGVDGNHPECSKQGWFPVAVRLGERCPYGYEPGIPNGYPVSVERNKKRAQEIMERINMSIDKPSSDGDVS